MFMVEFRGRLVVGFFVDNYSFWGLNILYVFGCFYI